MTRLRVPKARRARTAGGLVAAAAAAALFLAPAGDDTAGYAVARIPSGIAVAADLAATPPPASVPAAATDRVAPPPATATPPETVAAAAPATPGPASPTPPPPAVTGRDEAPIDPCPPPPPGAVPPEAATAQVGTPPTAGTYEYLVQPAGASGPGTDPDRWVVAATAPDAWDLTVPLAAGWVATSALRLSDKAIELTSWTLRHGDESTTVRPILPVPDLVLPASAGTSWDETSYDLSTRVAVRSTGRYLERQAVPLCGSLVEAWKVETTLAITPLPAAGPDAPTATIAATRWVATQRGGLDVRTARRLEGAAGGERTELEGTWYLRELDPR